ncbi:MAG: tetratricopeptide repeat-containing sensor histidine kinase [Opitutales bacterium]|nr:tetratricopeptide repeat-containing sensor histidine kinase [Opitutales bacterium]
MDEAMGLLCQTKASDFYRVIDMSKGIETTDTRAPAKCSPVQRKEAADAALARGKFVEACGLYQALLREPPDDSLDTRLGLLKGLAIAAARSARFEEALPALDEWDQLCRRHDRDRFLVLKFRGNCLSAMDLFHPALEAYREAWALVRDTDRYDEGGAVLNNIGSIYERLKNHEAAREHFRLSIKTHEKSTSPVGLRHATYNLALNASHQGDYEGARKAYTSFLEEAEREGHRVDCALGNFALAEVFAHTGDEAAAARHFSIAQTIYEETGQREFMVQLRLRQIERMQTLKNAADFLPCPLAELTDIVDECIGKNWHEFAMKGLRLKSEVYRNRGEFAAACGALERLVEQQKTFFEGNAASQVRALGILHRTEMAVAEAAAERQRSQLLEENLRATEAQRQRAADADEMKTRVLRIVSHELRNPLGAIAGCLEMAAEGEDAEEKASLLQSAREVSEDALQLLNQLLEAAEMESETARMELLPLDLNDVLVAAVARFQTVATKKNQTLLVELTEEALTVRADETRLAIIADNLISNAIKYSPPGAALRTGVKAGADGAILFVTDEGPGLNEADQAQLFQLFGRIARARPTGNEKSVGLGLYIARHIARLHGGDVAVASEGEGKGSTFQLMLPSAV